MTESTAIQALDPSSLADALAGVEISATGLEDTSGDDVRLATLSFNSSAIVNGDQVPKNRWYCALTEEVLPEVECTLVTLRKSREWTEYDEANGEYIAHCRSSDCRTGVMADGTERSCAGCPDFQWQTENGRRVRRCGETYNVAGVREDDGSPFVVRFRRSSFKPFNAYLNKHFLGRGRSAGLSTRDVPLFAVRTKMALKMTQNGAGQTYAEPVFTALRWNDAASIQAYARECAALSEAIGLVPDAQDSEAAPARPVIEVQGGDADRADFIDDADDSGSF